MAVLEREADSFGPCSGGIADAAEHYLRLIQDVIMRGGLLPTEGRPGTATARLISGARGHLAVRRTSASTVLSA
jgi:hypothetical protein